MSRLTPRSAGAFVSLLATCIAVVAEAQQPTQRDRQASDASVAQPAQRAAVDQIEFFEAKIRPVLIEHCYECHNSESVAEADLILDHRDALRRGGVSGATLADDASKSLLLRVMRHEIEGLEMPEGGARLSDAVLADFERWIAMGAVDPRDAAPSAEELEKSTSWEAVREKRSNWWSLKPISSPPVPLPDNDWSNHPIDRFVLAKLNEVGLQPAAPADHATLARRLYFALTGLPPTADQIDAFVQASESSVVDSVAYERLVDALLDSPQFGPRWGRHWMDWLRYAQSHGSEGDPLIDGAHHYRDYVIRAFNADVPCDQLIREHIAGDLLDAPRVNKSLGINESLIGTAHWRMVFHGFAPTDALDERVRFTDDAIDVVTKAFLGLTVSCARCHNHKFDAISQEDYYATFGIVSSTRPGRVAIETADRLNLHRRTLSELKPRIRDAIIADWQPTVGDLAKKLRESTDLSGTQADATKEAKADSKRKSQADASDLLHPLLTMRQAVTDGIEFEIAWQRYVDQFESLQQKRAAFEQQAAFRRWDFAQTEDARQWFVNGNGSSAEIRSDAGTFAIVPADSADNLTQPTEVIGGIFPSAAISHAISTKHGNRLTSPDFHLDGEFDIWLQIVGDGEASSRYVVQNYPRSGTVYPVAALNVDGHPQWRWQRYDLDYWNGDNLHVEMATARDAPLLVKNRDRSWFGIRHVAVVPKDHTPPTDWREHLAPLMQLAASQKPRSIDDLASLYPLAIERALQAWRAGTIDDAQAIFLDRLVAQQWVPNDLKKLSAAAPLIDRYRQLETEIPVATRVPSIDEWTGQDHPLFVRGDHKQPADLVPRRFLEVIDDEPYQTTLSGRRQWAKDLLADDNPLVARVIVNRVWHHLFGAGIVTTTDNFGRLGSTPSHPELLDYLATQFRETGWSFKQLIRQIVTSRVWQQQSVATDQARQVDPDNRLLSYRSVMRLEAEAIRDALLFVSGQLQMQASSDSVSGTSNQRSVYVQVRRNALDPLLSMFDAPVPFTCKGRRDVTNVPAQALMMMNDPFVVRAAERLADTVLNEVNAASVSTESTGSTSDSDSDSERVVEMWRRALSNAPTSQQQQQAIAFVQQMQAEYVALQNEREQIAGKIRATKASIDQIVDPARKRLLDVLAKERSLSDSEQSTATPHPEPIAGWSFDESLQSGKPVNAKSTSVPLTLRGSAAIRNGALILDGNGWAETAAIDRDLSEKSFEAIVQLDTLQQVGGGVISLQTTDGVLFDAIVFGEQQPQHWLSGSNNFRRTSRFEGFADDQAAQQPIHLVITYAKDGTITCYRNGRLYGKPYKTELMSFPGDRTQVLLGMRHGKSAAGNRMLRGRLFAARLYNSPLTASQIQSLASRSVGVVAEEQIEAALEASQLQELRRLRDDLGQFSNQQEQLGPQPKSQQAWIDLAHSLLNLKEFIYVR